MLTQLFNNPILYSLSLSLLHFLWQGFLIGLVLKSVLLVVSKEKSLIRYTASSLAMLATLVAPLITFYVIYVSTRSGIPSLNEHPQLAFLVHQINEQGAWFNYQMLMTALPELFTFILPCISAIWFVIVACLSVKLLIELNNVNKLPKTSTIEPPPELTSRFQLLARQIGLKGVPKLLISLHVGVPMVIGWLKPVVLLPASMVTGLNNAQLEMLILHELAHIRRHDYLVNFFQTLIEILFFFHPSVHWVSRQMRNEREYCSDDIAVKHCGDAIAYAHTLADTAALSHEEPRYCHKYSHTTPELAMAASGGDLKQRIVRIVNHHCAPNKDIGKWFAAASIIASVLFISSQGLINLSNAAFEGHNQQTIKSSLQEKHIPRNNFTSLKGNFLENKNNNFSDPAVTTIAGSLLKSGDDNELIDAYREAGLTEQEKPIPALLITKVVTNSAPIIEPVKSKSLTFVSKEYTSVNSTTQNIDTSSHNKAKAFNEASLKKPQLKHYTKQLTQKEITHKVVVVKKPQITLPVDKNIVMQDLITRTHPAANLDNTLDFHNVDTQQDNNLLPVSSPQQHFLTIETQLNNNVLADSSSFSVQKSLDKKIINKPVLLTAKQLKVVSPVYPSAAKRKGIEIDVKVNFTIDVDGHIKNIHFSKQNKLSYFKSSIKSAIKQWKYAPAKLNNKPIESNMSKIFSFNLQS